MDFDGNVPRPLPRPVGEVEIFGADVEEVPEVEVWLAVLLELQDLLGGLGVVVGQEGPHLGQLGRQAVLVGVGGYRDVKLKGAPGKQGDDSLKNLRSLNLMLLKYHNSFNKKINFLLVNTVGSLFKGKIDGQVFSLESDFPLKRDPTQKSFFF